MAAAPAHVFEPPVRGDDGDAVGFCALQLVDQDGLPRRGRRCCRAEAPWHLSRRGAPDGVLLRAEFADSPFLAVELSGGSGDFLAGAFWDGGGPRSRANVFAVLVSRSCDAVLADAAEGLEPQAVAEEATVEASLPFLDGGQALARLALAPSRGGGARLAAVTLELPHSAWASWMARREAHRHHAKLWPEEGASRADVASEGGAGPAPPAAGEGPGFEGLQDGVGAAYDDSGPPPPCSIL